VSKFSRIVARVNRVLERSCLAEMLRQEIASAAENCRVREGRNCGHKEFDVVVFNIDNKDRRLVARRIRGKIPNATIDILPDNAVGVSLPNRSRRKGES